MSKVRTFSRQFPKGHPSAGKPTFFIEKILNQLKIDYSSDDYLQRLFVLNAKKIADKRLSFEDIETFYISLQETGSNKLHTIRGGKHFTAGEQFQPCIWYGNPYNSPQIKFAPDVVVKRVYDIGLRIRGDFKEFYCGDCDLTGTSISLIAKNDGLEENDFLNWFTKPFDGQIICWSDVQY